MMIPRLLTVAALIGTTASCSILAPIFGFGDRVDRASPYASAMADFSTCETAPDMGERAAAAARLSAAAQSMAAVTRPTDPDHFYQMDRMVAAAERCQAAMAAQ